jgi:hypothetical protein
MKPLKSKDGRKADFPKKKRKEAIVFDIKSRCEFLGGFSKRKAERKKKGNLKNLKKELKRKKDEQNSYKHHIRTEYQKAVSAARHNMGVDGQEKNTVTEDQVVIEERVDFYPQDKSIEDPFGDVSIQISALESPQFTTLNRALPSERPVDSTKPVAISTPVANASKKKIPTYAKFKQMSKSSQVFQKRKDKRRENKRKPHDKTKKKTKKKQKKHS